MFPYSLGAQAPTKAKSKSDLVAEADALAEKHPEDAEKYEDHLDATVRTASALIDLLPDDVEDKDVAVSVAGHLGRKKNEAGEMVVYSVSAHISADYRAVDPSKYSKPAKKAAKAAKGAPAADATGGDTDSAGTGGADGT